MAAGSGSRSTPLLGLAFLTSAITAAAWPAATLARSAAAKPRGGAPGLGLAAHVRQRAGQAGGRHLLVLDGDDALQDVRGPAHAASFSWWLTATNWLSLAMAAPEATASRARLTPSAMLSATPAQ
jgi:hypothetical protein